MPNTYTELRKTTVGTATSSINFDLTGISGYTDLRLVIAGTGTTPYYAYVYFNGDTGSNYSRTELYGNGTSAASFRAANSICVATDATQNNMTLDIMNYSNATTFKTFLYRQNRVTDNVLSGVALWRSTSAITSIAITGYLATTFATGTTFSLYGIANADQGAAKATGGVITEDATYWYHTFGASGAFVPKQSLTCDILVVAGGGGGGSYSAGGGAGAGGLVAFTSQSLSSGVSQNVTIGGGGAGSTSENVASTNGVNSQFAALTAAVGGGSGGSGSDVSTAYWKAGGNGGSGGGGGGRLSTAGGTQTTGQGFAGGRASSTATSGDGAGGGGGGAGAAGATGGSATAGGNGGDGLSTYSSWLSVAGVGVLNSSDNLFYIAGGGAGNGVGTGATQGIGGKGGGGSVGVAGVVNTGGGGAASGAGQAGKAGGSGVVIIRYAK